MTDHLTDLDGDSPISAVATFDVATARPSDDLTTLAGKMRAEHVGALFVEGHEGQTAILTERDLVHAFADDYGDSAWAVDCMSRDLVCVPGSTPIADAAEMMLVADIRHIVVEREDGVLGIASVRDLIRPLVDGLAD